MLAGAKIINVLHDALSAEIHSCLAALTTAMDHGMSHILLETDSTILEQVLRSSDHDFTVAGVLIREAKFLISTYFCASRCGSCATIL
jgi:hypothetical protein